ncbi:MAG: glycosyltransferase family 4 protein [Porphyrobacter sp.]|nr:glycosyltransferase family 4 protein [Porphyrobacter sp.]
MKVVVAQIGARMHYAVPRILADHGLLERLYTDTYIGNKKKLKTLLVSTPSAIRPRALDRWLGRSSVSIPSELVTNFERLGLEYKFSRRFLRKNSDLDRIYADFGRRFCEQVAEYGFGEADIVYCFNGAALEVFKAAKIEKKLCVLEQTMAPLAVSARLIRAEEDRWPQYTNGEASAPFRLTSEREEAEWLLADIIVCPSQFVVDGIAERGGPAEKCYILPYGVGDAKLHGLQPKPKTLTAEPLRILFCGEVGLRKGAHYLLEAVKQVQSRSVEVRLAGAVALPSEVVKSAPKNMRFEGRVPRSQIMPLYSWADVLVLPSICEGSATVIYEAIMSGISVICTPNSGPPNHSGITVIPAGDLKALVHSLETFQTTSDTFSYNSADEYSLNGYGKRIIKMLDQVKINLQ